MVRMLLVDLVRGVRDTDLQNSLLNAIVIQHFLTKQGKRMEDFVAFYYSETPLTRTLREPLKVSILSGANLGKL